MEKQQEEPCGTEAMSPFIAWVVKHDEVSAGLVLYHVDVITSVLHNQLLVDTPAFTAPDVWSMERSAGVLRDMALANGFEAAAQYCEGTRQAALALIAEIEQVVQGVSGPQV